LLVIRQHRRPQAVPDVGRHASRYERAVNPAGWQPAVRVGVIVDREPELFEAAFAPRTSRLVADAGHGDDKRARNQAKDRDTEQHLGQREADAGPGLVLRGSGGGWHYFPAASFRRTRPTSMYCPPRTWWQW